MDLITDTIAIGDFGTVQSVPIVDDLTDRFAEAAFTISAVSARDCSEQNIAAPLGSVISTMNCCDSLGIHVLCRPHLDAPLSAVIVAAARGKDPECARLSLKSIAANVRQAINFDRVGYRLRSGYGEIAPLVHPQFLVELKPNGQLLTREQRRPPSVIVDQQLVSARIGRPSKRWPSDLPLQALVQSGFDIDLFWTLRRIKLNRTEIELLHLLREGLEVSQRTPAGDFRFSTDLTLSRLDWEHMASAMFDWTHYREGFESSLRVVSAGPLPNSLLSTIGQAVWGGRSFSINIGSQTSNNPGVLELAAAFPADELPPFELPSHKELRAVGVPIAWPSAPREVSRTGMVLGHSGDQPVRIMAQDRARHLYTMGSTGTGKSTLMSNMILQDIASGEGVFVLDPHGDLVDGILNNIPAGRAGDVVLLDASDTDFPFSLNFLQIDPNRKDFSGSFAISELLAIFWRLYGAIPESMGPAFEQYFTIALKLLIENSVWPEPTLLDVNRVMSDREFRNRLRSACTNPVVEGLLIAALKADGEGSWDNIVPYITNKLNRLTLNPLFRNTFCQTRSSVDFRKILDQGKITLVKLPKGELPELDVRLFGMLIVGKLFGAALSRQELRVENRRTTHVYIDEFQNFVTGTVGQMMAEARKYGLSMTLANQNLAQLDPQLRDTVLGNISSLLAFRVGPSDAATLQPFFAPTLSNYDLQELSNYHCAARILSNGKPVIPQFVMTTQTLQSLPAPHASVKSVICSSRKKYCRCRADVESDIRVRYNLVPSI